MSRPMQTTLQIGDTHATLTREAQLKDQRVLMHFITIVLVIIKIIVIPLAIVILLVLVIGALSASSGMQPPVYRLKPKFA